MTSSPERSVLKRAVARKNAERVTSSGGATSQAHTCDPNRRAETSTARRADHADVESLRDQVVVVTGGGRGIGQVLAQFLAAAGAVVVVAGRSPVDLARAVAEISAAGGRATSVALDVTDRQAVEAGMSHVEQSFGPIDLLINNAGLLGPVANLWEADPGEWWRTMEVHIGGTFLCSRAVLPGMISRGRGRIINVVSNAGVFRWPTCSAYSVSKAAVVKLTENLSAEVRTHGVTVFAFHPGLMQIGLSEKAFNLQADLDSPVGRANAWVRGEIAAGHAVSPERVAGFIAALATGQGDGLSGRYLTVFDDLRTLAAQAENIRSADLLTLRVRGL
jgi:NAD(P)-dependent dehydrogenase (short-subunit alcohol dehydrogenase family)